MGEAGGLLRQLLPFFIEGFQFFGNLCLFFCQPLAEGKIGAGLRQVKFFINLPVALFQLCDARLNFFEGVFFFAPARLFLLLGRPVLLRGGRSGGNLRRALLFRARRRG